METGIIEINKDLMLEYADPVIQYYFGTTEKLIGKKITEIPEFRQCDILSAIEKVAQGKPVLRRIRKSIEGKNRTLLLEGEPLLDKDRKIQRAAIIVQDITKLDEKYNLLTKTKNNFIRFIDYLSTGIIVTDPDRHILFFNNAAQHMVQTESGDLRILPDELNIKPGTRTEILLPGSHNKQQYVEVEVREIKWYREPSFLFTLRDITLVKQAEQQNFILLTAIQSTANAIAITNHELIIDWVNPAFTKLTGWKMAEAVGSRISDLMNIDGKTDESFIESIRNIIVSGKNFQTEIRHPRKDGTYFDSELTITPFAYHNTGNKQYIFVFNDLTKRKEKEKIITILNKVFLSMEKAYGLEESFIILREELLMNHIHSAFFLFNKEKKILVPRYYSFDTKSLNHFATLTGKTFNTLHIPVGINDKYEKIIYEKKTVFSPDVANDLQKIIPLIAPHSVKSLIRSLGIQHSIMAPVIDQNEEVFGIFQLFSDRLTQSNIPEVIAFANHLSFFLQKIELMEDLRKNYVKLKRSYSKLKASEKQYKDLFNNDLSGDYISTPEGKFLDCNQAFVKILGYDSKEEVLNLNPAILYPDIKERKKIFESLKKNKKILNLEEELIRKDGKRIYVVLNAFGVFDKQEQLIKNTGYIFDITKRKQYEKELVRAKEAAEESSRLKTAFLANMSHEIRTPLNAIMGFTELLQDESLSREERKNYTGIIKTSGQQLLKIIGGILEISRIEAGEIKIKKEPFDLVAFFHELYTLYLKNKIITDKKLDIHLDIPEEKERLIVSDRERLLEIYQNLLDNAIKYTPQGIINFGYKIINKNNLEFFVKDTGIGIKPENLERIFHRFQQEDNTLTRKYEGIGLGLAITRNLIHLLGGEIRVESTPNKGSVFYFTLPFVPQ